MTDKRPIDQAASSREPFHRSISWFIAIFLHLLALLILKFQAPSLSPKGLDHLPEERVPVRIVERQPEPPSEPSPEQPSRERQIVETPLQPTIEPAPDDAHLGAQNRRTDREQRLPPSSHRQGAPATRFSSRPKADEAKEQDSGQGKILMDDLAYGELLPDTTDFSGYYNDFIADESIPTGEVLDVNTTEYRFIAYFTSVRRQVDFAFYDPRSSLRREPRIQEQLVRSGQVNFRGVSIVQLTVLRSGLVTETKVVRSSGDRELDEAWLRILNLAAPFPPLPRHYDGDTLVFTYALYYDFALHNNQQIRRFHF